MRKSRFLSVVQYLFAGVVAFCTLAPYFWLFVSSLADQKDLTARPLQWIPEHISFGRYAEILFNEENPTAHAFKLSMGNSVIVAVTATLIGLTVGSLAAYALARLRFRFQQKLVYLFLFTYMIPSVVIVIPLYLLLTKLSLLDSKLTLVLLHLTFIIPFVIWVMQSYFASISQEFEEAAALDGCSRLQMLWHIVIPLIRPGLIATGILAFLLSWDEFFFALLFTSSEQAKTISVAIAEFSGQHAVDYGMIATGGVIASLPPLLIAIVFQRYLVQGMTSGGVKE